MNAAEQAKGVKVATKIAAVVNLFKIEFPDAKADLKPWQSDSATQELVDPDSIDIGFHFPGWSPRFQSRSILLQIRFYEDPVENTYKLIGLEMAGFHHAGQPWRFSTIENWQFIGDKPPIPKICEQMKFFAQQVFQLFK